MVLWEPYYTIHYLSCHRLVVTQKSTACRCLNPSNRITHQCYTAPLQIEWFTFRSSMLRLVKPQGLGKDASSNLIVSLSFFPRRILLYSNKIRKGMLYHL